MIWTPQSEREAGGLVRWIETRTGTPMPVAEHVLGVVNSAGVLLAGAAYHGRGLGTIHMTLAADTSRWCLPGVVTYLLGWPFGASSMHRITALCKPNNKRVRKLLRGVGFIEEARLRAMAHDGGDMMIYGMTRDYWTRSRWGDRWRRAETQARAMLEAA